MVEKEYQVVELKLSDEDVAKIENLDTEDSTHLNDHLHFQIDKNTEVIIYKK